VASRSNVRATPFTCGLYVSVKSARRTPVM
jgi:hypothetical protein